MQCRLAFGASTIAMCLNFGTAKADPVPMPEMAGPLAANANPANFDVAPLGKMYITGTVSGLAYWQGNPTPGDHDSCIDLDDGQVSLQATDGLVQFFVEAGAYSFPTLGNAYLTSGGTENKTYGVVPQAFVKIAPMDNFSIEVGKLPTLIGAEYAFTVENMNIQRGLLWYQEPTVSRGVQVNYSAGSLSISLSWNDGFYSNIYNWVSGSTAWTIDSSNTLSLIGGGNLGRTHVSTFATPIAQNNGSIYNLIYAHTSGPWTITPYIQYSRVPSDASLGIAHSASSFGGAVLASYAFDDNWKLAGRVEYISSSGGRAADTPSLLYGPGSNAWSFSITPTYQQGIFFARAEASYVTLGSATSGFEFGDAFSKSNQARLLLETGIVF